MDIENFIKNTKDAVKDTLEKRRQRLADPAFQAEMAQEKTKLRESFKKTGDHAFRAGTSIVVTGIINPLKSGFEDGKKQLPGKNNQKNSSPINMQKAVSGALHGFGKSAWDTGKFLVAAAESTGRLAKIAARYAIAR